MAAFDGRGFAAVDSFFQDSSDLPTSKREEPIVSKGRRLGVGASAAAEFSKSQALRSKRLLQVGKKRQRADDEDSDASIHEDDDDSDVGRTKIDETLPAAPKVSASVLVKAQVDEPAAKKKRKRGKKERQKANATETNANQQEAKRTKVSTDTTDETPSHAKKRKRRKIRSRQKNIYKDRRESKPEHLVPGSTTYQGRPLTPATRAKLQLPPSKTSTMESKWSDDQPTNELEAMPLAVEQDLGVVADTEAKQPKKTIAKKGKKPKYKNIR